MKKILVFLLALMMMTGAAVAEESAVLRAGYANPDALTQKAVLTQGADGAWSARTIQADALLDWFWDDGNKNDSPTVLVVELEGSAKTGLMTPVLRVYRLLAGEAEPVTAVSVLAGDVRYDFSVVCTVEKNGSKQAAVFSAPLDGESLQLVDALIGCEAVSVRMIGETASTAKITATGKTTKQKIAYAGIEGMDEAKAMLQTAGVYEYDLWDLNAAAWETAHGVAPAFCIGTVNKAIGTVETTDAFGMVVPGATTDAAKAAQQLLIDAGFMAGNVEQSMNKRAVAAVVRAQKHYGLIPSGCMDGMLAQLLAGGAAVQAEAEAAADATQIGGVIGLRLDRWWVADAVQAMNAETAVRTVANSDNCLIVADGCIENMSGEAIRFMIEARAALVLNGQIRYEAVMVRECSGGTELDTQMMPCEDARVIIYAEVPQQLLESGDAAWTLEVTAGGETAAFALK